MTLLAPTLEAFFTQHLAGHRQASPRTIGSYRDTWRLFLGYALDTTGTAPRPRHRRPRRRAGQQLPRPPRAGAGQHRPDAQRETGRDPVGLQVRRPAPPRARCDDRPGPRDPREEARPGLRLLPHRRRDQGPARRPGHHDVARPPRPRVPRPCRPDRAAVLRAHRAHPRRRPDRDRTYRPLPRQGTQGPRHPAHREHRRRDPHLAPPAARRARRSAVPDHYRAASVLRRRPGPGRTAHRDRGGGLPVHPRQKRHPAHPAAFRGHGPAARRGRSRHDRPLDGAREPPVDAAVHPRRPQAQREGPGPDLAGDDEDGQVPATGQAPRVPRGPGIMPLA